MICKVEEDAEKLDVARWFGGEESAQGGATSGKARLDGTEVDVEDLRDLFVGEAFNLAKDHDGAEGLGKLAQGGFDVLAEFGLGGVVEGGICIVGEGCAETEAGTFRVGVWLGRGSRW